MQSCLATLAIRTPFLRLHDGTATPFLRRDKRRIATLGPQIPTNIKNNLSTKIVHTSGTSFESVQNILERFC